MGDVPSPACILSTSALEVNKKVVSVKEAFPTKSVPELTVYSIDKGTLRVLQQGRSTQSKFRNQGNDS